MVFYIFIVLIIFINSVFDCNEYRNINPTQIIILFKQTNHWWFSFSNNPVKYLYSILATTSIVTRLSWSRKHNRIISWISYSLSFSLLITYRWNIRMNCWTIITSNKSTLKLFNHSFSSFTYIGFSTEVLIWM